MTIAQQLKVKEFPFVIKDLNGNIIYYECSNGYWYKREYDSNKNLIYYEDSDRYWWKSEYDSNRNIIYYEDSTGDWCKSEYNLKGKEIYCEDSDGRIVDKRPKPIELTLDEIATKFGINVSQLKIKK